MVLEGITSSYAKTVLDSAASFVDSLTPEDLGDVYGSPAMSQRLASLRQTLNSEGGLQSSKPSTSVSFQSAGPIDISALTRVAKDDLGLLPQPAVPKFKTALVQIYVRGKPYGGSDKSSNGHRYDSIPFANGMINAGISCQLIHYVYEEHDKFIEIVKGFDALIVRCNPGQIKADGGSQEKFDDAMRALQKSQSMPVWPSPDVMEFMGAKDALTNIKDLSIGLPDTLSYYDETAFIAGFKKTMAFQPRVIKQNRGSSGGASGSSSSRRATTVRTTATASAAMRRCSP